MSSSNEVEPYLAKSVKLLFAKEEDSGEELRALLEETIRAKYGPKKAQAIANLAHSVGQPMKRRCPSPVSEDEDGNEENNAEEEEDDTDVVNEENQKEIPYKRIKAQENSVPNSPVNFDNENSNNDSEDLMMEIFEENVCVICRSMATDPKNQIIECQDCHDLYHKNCAIPSIDPNVNDPRFVWYCKKCSKGANKTPSNPTSNKIFGGSLSAANSSSSSSSGNNSSSSLTNVNAASSSSSNTSTAKPSTSKLSSANPSRLSSLGNFAMASKPFGNKFKLFKTAKR